MLAQYHGEQLVSYIRIHCYKECRREESVRFVALSLHSTNGPEIAALLGGGPGEAAEPLGMWGAAREKKGMSQRAKEKGDSFQKTLLVTRS